jgi:hypothetical protein
MLNPEPVAQTTGEHKQVAEQIEPAAVMNEPACKKPLLQTDT